MIDYDKVRQRDLVVLLGGEVDPSRSSSLRSKPAEHIISMFWTPPVM
jgi:hypothetical protein